MVTPIKLYVPTRNLHELYPIPQPAPLLGGEQEGSGGPAGVASLALQTEPDIVSCRRYVLTRRASARGEEAGAAGLDHPGHEFKRCYGKPTGPPRGDRLNMGFSKLN